MTSYLNLFLALFGNWGVITKMKTYDVSYK